MARRKRPEGETALEADIRRRLEAIADNATRSEKVSWERKMANMAALLEKLRPIEDQILDLMASKIPIIDEITSLRKDMVRDCIHPYVQLVDHDDHVTCNFCSKNFNLIQHGRTKA